MVDASAKGSHNRANTNKCKQGYTLPAVASFSFIPEDDKDTLLNEVSSLTSLSDHSNSASRSSKSPFNDDVSSSLAVLVKSSGFVLSLCLVSLQFTSSLSVSVLTSSFVPLVSG